MKVQDIEIVDSTLTIVYDNGTIAPLTGDSECLDLERQYVIDAIASGFAPEMEKIQHDKRIAAKALLDKENRGPFVPHPWKAVPGRGQNLVCQDCGIMVTKTDVDYKKVYHSHCTSAALKRSKTA